MEVPFRHLQPGHYLVLRRFGKNRLYRVTGRPEDGKWLGPRIRARHTRLYLDRWEDALITRFEGSFTPKGSYVFRMPFYVALWGWLDLLFGRPRWNSFTTRDDARRHMLTHPEMGVIDLIVKVVIRTLPPRGAAIALACMGVVALALFPLWMALPEKEERW